MAISRFVTQDEPGCRNGKFLSDSRSGLHRLESEEVRLSVRGNEDGNALGDTVRICRDGGGGGGSGGPSLEVSAGFDSDSPAQENRWAIANPLRMYLRIQPRGSRRYGRPAGFRATSNLRKGRAKFAPQAEACIKKRSVISRMFHLVSPGLTMREEAMRGRGSTRILRRMAKGRVRWCRGKATY